jgi:TatD DNase family protein
VATYKNGGLDQVIPEIGLEHLVLETDAPYLSPAPFRGKRNSPAYIPVIAAKIGDYLGISKTEVARKTSINAVKLFNEFSL